MSKSILVIDTPDVCIDCPCHFAYDTGMVECGVNEKELLTDDIETFKPDWCPLNEFSEKKVPDCTDPIFMSGAKNGYNDCIDEILKED